MFRQSYPVSNGKYMLHPTVYIGVSKATLGRIAGCFFSRVSSSILLFECLDPALPVACSNAISRLSMWLVPMGYIGVLKATLGHIAGCFCSQVSAHLCVSLCICVYLSV